MAKPVFFISSAMSNSDDTSTRETLSTLSNKKNKNESLTWIEYKDESCNFRSGLTVNSALMREQCQEYHS
jgi:hypothetical protein